MYGNKIGEMAWMDLSVPNATAVKTFYQQVLGWQSEPMKMTLGDEQYNDFVMSSSLTGELKTSESTSELEAKSETSQEIAQEPIPETSAFVTGICHAKGANADMPATWLPYFLVADIDVAVSKVKAHGGELVTSIKSMGEDRYTVIKDPAGAMCAIYQKA